MRVALFIIIIFLAQLMHEFNIMEGLVIDILSVIAAWRLLDSYGEHKKMRLEKIKEKKEKKC